VNGQPNPPDSLIRPTNEEAAGTRWVRKRECPRDYINTEEKRRNISKHGIEPRIYGRPANT